MLRPIRHFIARRHPLHLVLALSLFVLAGALNNFVKPLQAQYFPLRFVRVQGAFQYLDKRDLERRIQPLLERGYWEMDLEAIRSQGLGHPWISAVQIQRVWPDTLVLKVQEHRPFARFGERHLISNRGIAFAPDNIAQFDDLPRIDGPLGLAAELLIGFLNLQETARGLGVEIAHLRVTERESWSLETSNGLSVELGRQSPVETFRRFAATISLLGEQQIQSMVRVDLRYRNGFSVEWKPGTEPEWNAFVKRNDPHPGEAQSI